MLEANALSVGIMALVAQQGVRQCPGGPASLLQPLAPAASSSAVRMARSTYVDTAAGLPWRRSKQPPAQGRTGLAATIDAVKDEGVTSKACCRLSLFARDGPWLMRARTVVLSEWPASRRNRLPNLHSLSTIDAGRCGRNLRGCFYQKLKLKKEKVLCPLY